MSDQWYYADSQQQQIGPVPLSRIQELVRDHQIRPETLVWNQAMPNWTPAGQVREIASSSSPPPIQSAASPNPYHAPTATPYPTAAPQGSYPIPHVKKCSFPLYLTLFILSLLLTVALIVPIVMQAVEVATELPKDFPPPPETPEEAAEYERLVAEKTEEAFADLASQFTPATLALIGSLFIAVAAVSITLLVVGCIYLYRAWFILQPGGARTTPGLAVGLLFIPLFNLYWIFVSYVGWAKDWNRIQASHQNLAHLPRASEGLFIATFVCLLVSIIPILGYLSILVFYVLFLMVVSAMCRIVNGMADTQSQSY